MPDEVDARFQVQLALHTQISDNSASCWSIGRQQFGTKGSDSRPNFRQTSVRSVRLSSARLQCAFCDNVVCLALEDTLNALKLTLNFQAESWLHLSFRGHGPYRFRRDNRGCPGLMLDHLQPIPDTENLPFYRW